MAVPWPLGLLHQRSLFLFSTLAAVSTTTAGRSYLLWILPETGDTCAGKMVIVLKNFIGGEFVETKNTSSDNVIER